MVIKQTMAKLVMITLMTLLSLSLFITGTFGIDGYDFPEKGSATVAAEVSEVGNATTLDVFKRCLACRCCIGDGRFCFNTKCCYQIYCKIPGQPPDKCFFVAKKCGCNSCY
ncbi:uncharacterized protein LOC109709634 [Ananas comosus]|uniref:Uncharacterized protein LOC109709634 n=1 Tax=Ananas comosus TaxID=4615 RepID=A0A6P5EVF1_ANACO|nr:uncharacterized protein LOC109709634 [Ananas comosus]